MWVGVTEPEETGAVVSILKSRAVEEVCVTLRPSIVACATARTAYRPSVSTPVVHDHTPVVLLAVQVAPVFVHVPLDGLVNAAAVESCTTAPRGAEPVKVSVVRFVTLSSSLAPLSDATARSGVDTVGSS